MDVALPLARLRSVDAPASERRLPGGVAVPEGSSLLVSEPARGYGTSAHATRTPEANGRVLTDALVQARGALIPTALRLPAIQHACLKACDTWVHTGRLTASCRASLLIDRDVSSSTGERLSRLHAQIGCPRDVAPWSAATGELLAPQFVALPVRGAWLATRVEALGAPPDPGVLAAAEAAARWLGMRNALVEAHLGLVVAIARRVPTLHVPLEDRIQAGSLALTRAIERFDPARGTRLASYLGPVIERAIRALIRETPPGPETPGRANPVISLTVPPRMPPRDEHAMSPLRRRWRPRGVTVSTDVVMDDAFGSLADRLVDPEAPWPDELAIRARDAERLRAALPRMRPRERRILTLLFGLDGAEAQDLRAVGALVGLSAEGVRDVRNRALTALARLLTSPSARLGAGAGR